MKFAIISHAEHFLENEKILSYAPYVKEMNIWLKYVDEVKIVAPVVKLKPNLALLYKHYSIKVNSISAISLTSFREILKAIFLLPKIFFKVIKAMQWAEHIHLRCPGNIGLIGCIVQIFFPKKLKTVKYAGNWDPNVKQPLSYKLQKWILNNTFLSKNITVLVYGEWENQSKNIKPFFTASFAEEDAKMEISKTFSAPIKCMFVGSLVSGKRPMFAVRLVEQLRNEGVEISLKIFGDGILKSEIEAYIKEKKLSDYIKLKGNQPLEKVTDAYKEAQFLILASKSEGWPKAVAEAMFWGTIPIATEISCVPWMLDFGKRGILVEPEVGLAARKVLGFLKEKKQLESMSEQAMKWSRKYTLDFFETEIAKLLKQQKIEPKR